MNMSMKRIISIALILMVMAVGLCAVSVPAFAEEGAAESNTEQTLEGIKSDMGDVVDKILVFIKSDETYEELATILLAVLLIIFVPIIVGLFFIAYLIIAVLTLFASALGAVIEMLTGLLVGAMFI